MREWVDLHSLTLFFVLCGCAAAGAAWAWHRRGPFEDVMPVPMLRKRTASVLLLMTGMVFAVLAWSVMGEGRLVALDLRVHGYLRETFGNVSLEALGWLTWLGDDIVLTVLSLAVLGWLLSSGQRLLAGVWAFGMLGNGLLIRILKLHFQRTRPIHDHGFAIETGYSFPSGHAAGSLVFYGLLAYVLLVLVPQWWHRRILTASLLLIVVIGSSRVMLQVHFLSDVFAGYALGLGWLALCIGLGEFLRTARRRVA